MTARKPRPVVRVVIEVYPLRVDQLVLKLRGLDATRSLKEFGYYFDDYRRPRVVSVKKVRGAKR